MGVDCLTPDSPQQPVRALDGAGQSRIQVLFQAPEGPRHWLNQVQAIGFGQWLGDGSQYDVYALV